MQAPEKSGRALYGTLWMAIQNMIGGLGARALGEEMRVDDKHASISQCCL